MVSTCSEGVLSLLVELLGSSDEEVAVAALRLTRSLMLKYDWRVPFATEGGVRALLSCMHQFSSAPHVQQVGLAVSPPAAPLPLWGSSPCVGSIKLYLYSAFSTEQTND